LFLPKSVYENLPFVYFIVSGCFMTFSVSWPMLLSAGLFYVAGCITLVIRSSHRRIDKHNTNFLPSKIPELVYEFLPYTYGAIGIFTIMVTSDAKFQFCAFILIVLAIRNLLCRHNNRTKTSNKLFK
jgi:hypothetical protein